MRTGARTKLAGLLIAGVTLALGTVATATVVASADQPSGPSTKTGKENTNSTGYWEKYLEGKGYDDVICEKFEPVATPYVVPPGDWVLLVLKAGSGAEQNALIWDPVPGTGYHHPSDKDISHAILCSGTPGPSPTPTPTPTKTSTPSEPPEPTPSESSTPPAPSETPTPPPASSEPPTPPASSEPPSGTPKPPSGSPAPSETPVPTATPTNPRPGFGTGTGGGEAWPLITGLGVIGTGVAGTGLTLLLKRIRRR